MTIYLRATITKTSDQFGFYTLGKFDIDQFAEAFDLNAHELDQDSVREVMERAAGLVPGEWLKVEFMREG